MKVVDLFCGCGGMGLGFQQAGFEIVYACDIDKYAVQSYRHNIGDHGVIADITKLKAIDVPKADVWTFGFPCQDLSVAGKQAGMEVGTRSGLFYEVMRLLDECEEKPQVIMAENVKGLKSYFPTLEQEFAKRGYQMTVRLYNSKYWGVPQNRERYYVVGYLNGALKMPKEILHTSKILNDILDSEETVEEKHYLPKRMTDRFKELPMKGEIGVVGTVQPDTAKGTNSRMWVHDTNRLVGAILACDYKQPKQIVVAGMVYDSEKTFKLDDIDQLNIRRLTPREYARLQGFPESYEIVVSDTQAYKQFGNSVTVPLVKAIAESIKAVLLNEQVTVKS